MSKISERRKQKSKVSFEKPKDQKKFVQKTKTFIKRLTYKHRRSSRKKTINDDELIEQLCSKNRSLKDVLVYILSHPEHTLYKTIKKSLEKLEVYDFLYAFQVYDKFGKKEEMREMFENILDPTLTKDDLLEEYGDTVKLVLDKNDEVNQILKLYQKYVIKE